MKKSILILFTVASIAASAQSKFMNGGFGHFYTGVATANLKVLNSYLEQPGVLGPNKSLRTTGTIVGGQGFAMFRGKYLLGGHGGVISLGKSQYANGYINAGLGTGMFNFGYVISNKNTVFSYVYGGIGGGAFGFDIENTGDSLVYFDETSAIASGGKTNYSLDGSLFELGYSIKVLYDFKGDDYTEGKGGMILGLDGGVMYNVGSGGWKDVAIGPPAFDAAMFYLRLTIGGGGFDTNTGND